MKTNVLVTGGAGFIGSHVAKHCLKMGYEVVVLDDLSGGFEDHIPEGARFVKGSVTDHELVTDLFTEHRFTYVYHLAAYAAEGLSHFIRRYNYNTNLIGSINLINESVKHKVKCFVFTSSIAVYGKGQLPMTEEMTPEPEDPYGVSKYAVELDLRAAHEMFGLNYAIFRPHNVYGENQNIGDKYRNVIGIFMNQIMQGKKLTIFGDGTQTRAFSYIDDVAIPIAQCVNIPGSYNQVFNVGADKPYTVNELAKVVCKEFGVEPDINYLSARNEVMHAYSDHSKARRIFGEPSGLSLEAGISRMAKWAKAVGARQGQEFGNIEIAEKLPDGWGITRQPVLK
ncbi:MAG: NAD-dependent epimerase/dehydratase family protein [Bacteroidota bacterium]|nr:NAD-dependent epimerase/dehydratase family protein [Bacteroidota bacterium]MDP4218098.1 NAD-dependent epimerase/dehydratase family protein [Bacteroidota bacterium]MDP4246908.1 NAD-dependent epimerase/dehydratase family protein [Bacteroidota bacterium]MDP4254162.1 NAD-dependent epimerase/dehydratase family protein [Bacteroidota bacterium]MDP4260411.1 NAD-dependent epimerase/dehydratase family protein [Bacteroidota bacterium]